MPSERLETEDSKAREFVGLFLKYLPADVRAEDVVDLVRYVVGKFGSEGSDLELLWTVAASVAFLGTYRARVELFSADEERALGRMLAAIERQIGEPQ